MIVLLILACAYGATRSSISITFLLEIMLVINIPLFIFILYKTLKNPLVNWDAIHIIANHYDHMPALLSFASASFVYTGYLNLGLFNRLITPNFRYKFLWSYPLLAFIILLITFFVPIGIHGTESISQYIFLWSATTDSTRMMYGFIDRMLFVFLIMLINLTLIFTMIGWHMMNEYLRAIFPKNVIDPDERKTPLLSYGLIGSIAIATMILICLTNELNVIKYTG